MCEIKDFLPLPYLDHQMFTAGAELAHDDIVDQPCGSETGRDGE